MTLAVERDGKTPGVARFPAGFWKGIDDRLHHPEQIAESLRRDENLWVLSTILFTITPAMSAFYGVIMGATNLLHGWSCIGNLTAMKKPPAK